MLWMPHILLIVFGLVAFVPEWRRTCLIICAASLANVLYQPLLELAAERGDQWILVVHGIADAITIVVLLAWGSKGRMLQASVLALFIAWNLALAVDYLAPPYPIDQSYMGVIFALNIIQILLISGGIYAVVGNAIKFILDTLSRPVLGGVRRSYNAGGSVGPHPRKHRDSVE